MDLVAAARSANLSPSDMAALARILRSIDAALTAGKPISIPAHANASAEAVVLARRLKSSRNYRSQNFPDDLFGEPAWDMMLSLFIADGEGYRLKISDLCVESGVPATTALRWIDRLIDIGMARKIPNPLDARSMFIEATDALRSRMGEYFQLVLARHLVPRFPTQ